MEHRSFWDALGLAPAEERLYQDLLRRPDRSLSRADVEVLTRLTDLELVRVVEDRIEPVDPRLALTSLARRQQGVLDQARFVADELGPLLSAARLERDPSQFFHVLRGSTEIVGQIVYLLEGARDVVLGTDAPPYVADLDDDIHRAEQRLLERGVTFRTLYDASALEDPRHVTQMSWLAAAGEQSRVLPQMSLKMLVVDGETVLLPLARTDDQPEPTALVLGGPAIVAALAQLFELLWQRGRDPQLGDIENATQRNLAPRQRKQAILELMALGLPDKSICSTLDISERTLRRLVGELQVSYSVTSRFQLGAQFARTRAEAPRARRGPGS